MWHERSQFGCSFIFYLIIVFLKCSRTIFVPNQGDKSKKIENVHFLMKLGLESAATFWFMIFHGLKI